MFCMPPGKIHLLSFVSLLVLLTACGGHIFHRVERGETLYSIGWVYGYDYRQLARWNNIQPPYALSPGQRIRVAPPPGQRALPLQEYRTAHTRKATNSAKRKTPAPVIGASGNNGIETTGKAVDKASREQQVVVRDKSSVARESEAEKHDAQSVITAAKTVVKRVFGQSGAAPKQSSTGKLDWRWPTKQRRVLQTFAANNPARQGLDIAGEKGSPVLAAATGRVVYAGSGLVRYGRLIIIKHNERYLSAYAHNQKLRVKEGDVVKAGQRIADMGRTGHLGDNFINDNRAKLHFEIRQNGKPVDPGRYLPK
ncbi:MAG TPA: LysM peptidoglycan-binding domain-containing protein [Gammaproteobacteria bacterium]|nr:LysM peptidoglycan-binding domain-containing protein [Gammaproteobacteria bacterium]